jgi:hypothetical protein
MDGKERMDWLKKARDYRKKKKYLLAAFCYEQIGLKQQAATMYLRCGEWAEASQLYYSEGFKSKNELLLKRAYEIEAAGKRGEYG